MNSVMSQTDYLPCNLFAHIKTRSLHIHTYILYNAYRHFAGCTEVQWWWPWYCGCCTSGKYIWISFFMILCFCSSLMFGILNKMNEHKHNHQSRPPTTSFQPVSHHISSISLFSSTLCSVSTADLLAACMIVFLEQRESSHFCCWKNQ